MSSSKISELSEAFCDRVEQKYASLGPDFDFGAPLEGVAPGNLWDGPSSWQSPACRGRLGLVPSAFEDHPYRIEIEETFDPETYRASMGGLGGVGPGDLLAHFRGTGYAKRAAYSREVEGVLNAPWYRLRYREELGLSDDEAARRHYAYQGRFEDRFPNPLTEHLARMRVHLWQMGKVGSRAVQEGMSRVGEAGLHLHFADAFHRRQPTVGVHYSRLLGCFGQEKKLVVCGVRDPVERVISGFFQSFETLGRMDRLGSLEEVGGALADRIVADLRIICAWFAHGFYSGLDVYAHDFDREDGFSIIENERLVLFLYRFRDLGRVEGAMAEFLGLPGFRLVENNISSQKVYADVLEGTRRVVRLPRCVLDSVYSTRFARHFFSSHERERAMERYSAS